MWYFQFRCGSISSLRYLILTESSKSKQIRLANIPDVSEPVKQFYFRGNQLWTKMLSSPSLVLPSIGWWWLTIVLTVLSYSVQFDSVCSFTLTTTPARPSPQSRHSLWFFLVPSFAHGVHRTPALNGIILNWKLMATWGTVFYCLDKFSLKSGLLVPVSGWHFSITALLRMLAVSL